jgi:predicted molibdopterin-dependent oxidoreductase YjgC
MLGAARAGSLRLLYVVGADPAVSYPAAGAWRGARERLGLLVVHDTFLTETARDADIVLPALTFAETAGTVANVEGRVQRRAQAVIGPGEARSDSAIFTALAARLDDPFAFASWEDVSAEIARIVPGWAEDARIAPPPISMPSGGMPDQTGARSMPASTGHGEAGNQLVLLTGAKLFDRSAAAVRCRGIRALAGDAFVAIHPKDAGRFGINDGDLCEVRSGRGALRLAARIWPGLHPGHAYVPLGFDAAPVATLVDEREATLVTVRALAPAVR